VCLLTYNTKTTPHLSSTLFVCNARGDDAMLGERGFLPNPGNRLILSDFYWTACVETKEESLYDFISGSLK
jgi:hypothetical protein